MNINFNYYVNNPRNLTILIYLILALFVLFLKPSLMFNDNYQIKKIGLGKNNTIFPYYIFSLILALIIYYIVNLFFIRLNK